MPLQSLRKKRIAFVQAATRVENSVRRRHFQTVKTIDRSPGPDEEPGAADGASDNDLCVPLLM